MVFFEGAVGYSELRNMPYPELDNPTANIAKNYLIWLLGMIGN